MMNTEDVQRIVQMVLDQEQAFNWWPVIISIVILGVGAYILRGYLVKKGENLATKEDIEEITTKVESVKASFQKENTVFLEKLRWELKAREQAERVAEYLTIARDLKESDSPEEYRRANRLNWELAMWLPEDLYKAMVDAVAKPISSENNPLSVVVAIRKYLLGDAAGQLTQDNIAHHAPGIGKNKTGDCP